MSIKIDLDDLLDDEEKAEALEICDLPEPPEMDWVDPASPKERHLTSEIMPFTDFNAMRKRIGGRNTFVPKTNFAPEMLDRLRENDVMKAIEDDFIFSSDTMEPDAILYLLEAIKMFRPQMILELGTGLSTLVLSALQSQLTSNGKKKISFVSIDQDKHHQDKIIDLARMAKVDDCFKAITLPMCRYKIGDEFALDEKAMASYKFDEAVLHDALGGVRPDMIIVDGPMDEKTKSNASFAKTLSIPILSMYAAPGAVFFMDRAYADPEIFAMEQWHSSGAAHILGVKAVGKGMMVGIKQS